MNNYERGIIALNGSLIRLDIKIYTYREHKLVITLCTQAIHFSNRRIIANEAAFDMLDETSSEL